MNYNSLDGTLLNAEGLGVAFGEKTILAGLDFSLPPEGVTALMGPSGTGKSTLLRTLAWQNQQNPRFRSWGRIEMGDAALSASNHATLVAQNTNLFTTRVMDFLSEQARQGHGDIRSPAALREQINDALTIWNAEDLLPFLDKRGIELEREAQRRIAIIGAVLTRPKLLLVDEPTTGLDDNDASMVLDLIAEVGRSLPLLVVLHNQQQARMAADDILLLAGGRIQAAASVQQFFSSPPNEVARHFVRTGSCNLPSPSADPATLCRDTAPVPPPLPVSKPGPATVAPVVPAAVVTPAAPMTTMTAASAKPAVNAAPAKAAAATRIHVPLPPNLIGELAASAIPEYRGPRGFRWIVPGKVGTMPLPGAVIDINLDLAALRTVGVTTLITLTYNDLPQDILQKHGLRNMHLSIYDRHPPSIGQLKMLTKHMAEMIQRGEVLAVHCRAGIGRTGTVVAGWLIKEGLTADAALQRIRNINKHYVQTEEQEKFLHDFEAHLLTSI